MASDARPDAPADVRSDVPADVRSDVPADAQIDVPIDARTGVQPSVRAVVPAGPSTGTPGGDGPVRDAAPQPLRDDTSPGGGLPVTAALHAALELVAANEAELGRLDAVAGDGDHGIGIVRGLRAAAAAARAAEPGPDGDPRSAGTALLAAGLAPADASGGASGALYGALLAETGAVLVRAPEGAGWAALLADAADAAQRAVGELGGAEVGEKTLLDALDPFRRELRARAADGLPTAWRTAAWRTAAEAATRAAADTARLIPTRGRAARMGVRGHGHPDAGAVSLALLLTAIGGTLR
ncbi:DAK2 domain containing protein [Streptomyces noursei ATCC 11455]|uniref:DAK2 domain-containing protein n=1 Tax=Streptomyces noursei TaxID=1971 RepID=UPI00081C9D5A|nr:DAK2 domain containing protein [Streptomyces noursei ATCC 11455]